MSSAPVFAPYTVPDEQLEYWAGVYLANRSLSARGISFEVFLAAPAQILNALARPIVPTGLVLLPAQRAVREEIEMHEAIRSAARRAMAATHSTHVSDGHLVERLKHRTWPRHARRRVFVEA